MKDFLFLVVFFLTACSSQPSFYKKGQIVERKMNDDIFMISFQGNSWLTEQDVVDMLYLRCSEVSLRNGYPYFIVLDTSYRIEEMKTDQMLTLAKNTTYTNKIKLLMKPSPGVNNYDAKAIYQKRIDELEKLKRDISSEK